MSKHIFKDGFNHKWDTGEWNHDLNRPGFDEWWFEISIDPAADLLPAYATFEHHDGKVEKLNASELRAAAAVFLEAAAALDMHTFARQGVAVINRIGGEWVLERFVSVARGRHAMPGYEVVQDDASRFSVFFTDEDGTVHDICELESKDRAAKLAHRHYLSGPFMGNAPAESEPAWTPALIDAQAANDFNDES